MICPNCNHSNPPESNFCNNCGKEIAVVEPNILYGIFYKWGGFGDGYNTSFSLEPTIEEALSWQNSAANLSINKPDIETFLGEVSRAELLPSDDGLFINLRLQVHNWWKLEWNGKAWIVGEKLTQHPETIGLSPLEKF